MAVKPITQVKRDFIARAVKNYGHHLLARETKIINSLWENFPSMEFWASLELPYKLNSLAFLKTERGWELLQSEWKKFNFTPAEKEKIEISNTNFFLNEKKDVDSAVKTSETSKNLRSILGLW